MADYTEFDQTQYRSGKIYPLQNPLKRGYGVADPDVNPAGKSPNARFVNQRNEKIDFWVEDMIANFSMTGTTAQSRSLRQFIPHNVVQPSITVTGRAPNSFQYNRLASFIRASHWNALNVNQLVEQGIAVRHEMDLGRSMPVPTVRLVIRNGNDSRFPYNGRNVKGIHVPWALEGYVKSMKAGAERFNQAPQFQFEFLIAESLMKPNLGLWRDTRVYGSQIKPWLDFIKKDGSYVTVNTKDSQTKDPKDQSSNNAPSSDMPTLPQSDPFATPGWANGGFGN